MRVALVHNNKACCYAKQNGYDLVLQAIPLLSAVLFPLTDKANDLAHALPCESAMLFPDISYSFFLTPGEVIDLLKERVPNLEITEITGKTGQLTLPLCSSCREDCRVCIIGRRE